MTLKRFAVVSTALLLSGFFMVLTAESADLTLRNAPAQVYFSPDSGAVEAVIKEIDNAAMEILVQAHSLTNPRIADALAGAKKRAVAVEVILDKSGQSGKSTSTLERRKIPVYIGASRINNDSMVIDKTTVVSGCLDFKGNSRDSSAGNLLIVKSKELAGPYLENWLKHKQQSSAYRKKEPPKRKS